MIYEDEHHYVKDSTGIWLPNISKKQLDIFNDYHRFCLITGPRWSTKTIGCMHKILRHLFDNNQAMVAMVASTIKQGKASGIWSDLTQIALPEWLNAGIGMKLTMSPRVTGDTRMSYFRVLNRHGTESECQLHAIEFCPDVVTKFRGSRYSMFYFSECDNFDDRIVFDIATDQLRSFTVPDDQMQWLADTNPPHLGPNHWLHDIFFKMKDNPNRDDPNFDEGFRGNIHRIEFQLDDNCFITEAKKKELKAKYSYRKSLYARFIEGKWEEDATEGHFAEVFNPTVHVLGSHNPGQDKEIAVPSEACSELIATFDLGDVNHAGQIVEKLQTQVSEHSPVITKFVVLDELVSVEEKISIREYCDAFMQKVEFWESYIKTNYKRKVRWRSWSDRSAIIRFRAAAECNDAFVMREVSGGKLMLNAVPTYRKSVRDRVKITAQLFHEDRLFISINCPKTITSIKMLKKGSSDAQYIARNCHLHPFDSLSYALSAEAPIDELTNSEVKVSKVPRRLVAA